MLTGISSAHPVASPTALPRSFPIFSRTNPWQQVAIPFVRHLANSPQDRIDTRCKPDELKVIGDAFEDAWDELASFVTGDPAVVDAARLSLAEIGLGIAPAGPVDYDRTQKSGWCAPPRREGAGARPPR